MADQNRTSNIQGQHKAEFNLPYRSGKDKPKSLPYAPKSVHVTSPFMLGTIDVRWDNPADYFQNNGLQVLGVNIYRAFDAPHANFRLATLSPVSSLSWRDQTQEVYVHQEDVLSRLNPGLNAEKEWFFHTDHKKIISPENNDTKSATVHDIKVEVDRGDGVWTEVIPFKIYPEEGLVYLNRNKTYDPVKNTIVDPVLPDLLEGGIRVSYYYLNGLIATDINRKIFYKVTTVAYDLDKDETIETPLDEVEAMSLYDMERIDWIWAEAIRRNKWLLEQTGDRVKLFLRKWNGQKCACYNETYGYSKGVGSNRPCQICYGTGYVGGYEGPFDILIAPPETEKAVNLMDAGLHVSYDWNTWTGPEPLLNERDVIIRSNNDRFFVIRPNYQGSRGATYQQHFSLAQVDQSDPVYTIPVEGGSLVTPPGWNAYREGRESDASPQIPIKPDKIPGSVPIGRTVTFENITT